ncbi:MAG TPA: tetratricopeptide repeat protein, partial [Blastocatellia bacterium]|nr:tetratricopeptide repeat protein [Blastocatellia bacterium]
MTRSCVSCAVAVAIVVLGLSARFAAGSTAASPPATDSQGVSSPAAPATVAQAREEITTLEPGKTIERELAGGRRDVFQISLSEGQVASIVVERRAMDLTLRWVDARETVRVTEELRPGHTQDVLDFAAEESGPYQIQLEPTYPKAAAGKYRLRIGAVRAVSEKDLVLYDARRQYSDSLNLFRTGSYDQAQLTAERALELREKTLGPDHVDVAASLNTLGLICTARGDYKRAEGLLQRALAIYDKAFGKGSLAAAEVDDSLAQNYNAKANYAEAERLAREALGVREKSLGADHFLVAASLVTLGEIFLAKAEYSTARAFAERALVVAGKSYRSEDLPYTEAASLFARVQMRQGNYAAAEELFLQNLHNRESTAGPNSLLAANSLQDLGLLYWAKIDNVKSEQMNLRALNVKEKILGPDHPQVANLLNNLGLIYYRRGDYITAESFFQRSLTIKQKVFGPEHPLVGVSLNNLGLMYWKQLDYSKAADCFRRSLAIQEKAHGSENLDITYALYNLGIIAKETGDYEQAVAYYNRALAIREKLLGPQHPDVGIVLEGLGILYRDKGDYTRAEPMLLRTLAITEGSRGAEHPDIVRHLSNLTQLYSARGDVAKAEKCFQRLSAIEEKNLPLNLAVGSERQKLAYFNPFVSRMEEIISFQARQDPGDAEARDLAATVLVYRKGRVLDALANNLGTLWNRSSAEDRAVLDQLNDVTSKLAALVLNGPQKLSIAEQQERIKALTAQREQLENEASRRSNGYFEQEQAITLAAVQAAMPADTALIEFGVYRPFDAKQSVESRTKYGDPRYIAYVIPARGEVRWKELGPAKEMDAAVNVFRQSLRDPKRSEVKQLARALDEKIMQPLRGFTGDAKRLLVSPDGQLDLVPFEALADEQGRYLVERFSISYLTTGRDLL